MLKFKKEYSGLTPAEAKIQIQKVRSQMSSARIRSKDDPKAHMEYFNLRYRLAILQSKAHTV